MINVQNLRQSKKNLTFPYLLQAKRQDDAQKVSFITDKKNPMKVGDLFYDSDFCLGGVEIKSGVQINPDDSVKVVAMRVDEILEERNAKGDYGFTDIEPFFQKAICRKTEVFLSAKEIGLA